MTLPSPSIDLHSNDSNDLGAHEIVLMGSVTDWVTGNSIIKERSFEIYIETCQDSTLTAPEDVTYVNGSPALNTIALSVEFDSLCIATTLKYSYSIVDSSGSITNLSSITFDSSSSSFKIESSESNDVQSASIEVTASLEDANGRSVKTLSKVFKVTFSPAVLVTAPVQDVELEPVMLVLGKSTKWQVPDIVTRGGTSVKLKSVKFVDRSDKFMSFDSQREVVSIDGAKMVEEDLGQHWIWIVLEDLDGVEHRLLQVFTIVLDSRIPV